MTAYYRQTRSAVNSEAMVGYEELKRVTVRALGFQAVPPSGPVARQQNTTSDMKDP